MHLHNTVHKGGIGYESGVGQARAESGGKQKHFHQGFLKIRPTPYFSPGKWYACARSISIGQNGKVWAVEDKKLDEKIAELRKKYGRPPNLIHYMWDDQPVMAFGDPHCSEAWSVRLSANY